MSRTSLPRPAAAGLALAATGAALLLTVQPALADTSSEISYLPAPTAPSTVTPGSAFTISGRECAEVGHTDAEVLVTIDDSDDTAGPAPVDAATGTWSMPLTLPAGTAAGVHVLHAYCDVYVDEFPYADVTVTVPGATSATAATTTPPKPTAAADCTVCRKIENGTPVAPGKKLTLRFAGYQPFERVSVVLHSTPVNLGTFTADAQGVITVAVAIPSSFSGAHSLVLTDSHGATTALPFTVADTAAAAELAYTGTDITVPAVLGSALVLAGGGALFVARRRTAGAPRA